MTDQPNVFIRDSDVPWEKAQTLEEWITESFFRGQHEDIAKLMVTLPGPVQEKYREHLRKLIRERQVEGGI